MQSGADWNRVIRIWVCATKLLGSLHRSLEAFRMDRGEWIAAIFKDECRSNGDFDDGGLGKIYLCIDNTLIITL